MKVLSRLGQREANDLQKLNIYVCVCVIVNILTAFIPVENKNKMYQALHNMSNTLALLWSSDFKWLRSYSMEKNQQI